MRIDLLLATFALAGCNLMTGVDNLSIDSDGEEDSSEGGSSSGNGSAGSGDGGTTNAGPTTSTSSGDTASSNTSNTTSTTGPGPSGGPTGDGVQESAATGTTQACEYPGGPYGNTSNKILSPSESWTGYAPGGSATTTVTPEDLFDCDGSRGINAVIFTTAQTTCGPCQQEAQYEIAPNLSSWASQGIVVVTLMYGGGASGWRNAFDLQDSYVVDDYEGSFFTGNGDATPTNVIWDPRTGKIVEWWQGSGGLEAAEQLAAQNAN